MTFPGSVPRFKVQHMVDWLDAGITSGVPIYAGTYLASMPNRVISVTPQTGRGLELEGMIDSPVVRIHSRGAINNLGDAEDIAYEIDTLILEAPINFDIAVGVHVNIMDRLAGAPSAISHADSVSRWVFTCSYIIKVFTNLV